MHGDVLAQLLVAADQIDEHADLGATVDVRRQRTLGRNAIEAADRHVLANLADQRGARRLDRALAHRQPGKCCDVGGIVVDDELGAIARQRDEVIVLGNEIGLRIHFDDGAELAIFGDADADDALGGNTGSCLARLVAELDAENLLGLGQIPGSLGQRLLALHHRSIGLLA